MPLLDRLTNIAPDELTERRPLRVYERDGLKLSLQLELGRLLNTRAPGPLPADPTVLDYGVPDFLHLYAANLYDRQALAEAMRQAIQAFEPRLLFPQVSLEPDRRHVHSAVGVISGQLNLGGVAEPISFAIVSSGAERAFAVTEVPIEGTVMPPRHG